MTLDLTPILTPLLQLAGIALAAGATWAVGRAASYFHISAQNTAIQAFDDALVRSIHAGAGAAADAIKANGYDHVDVQSQIVAWAAPYAMEKFGPALKNIGLDPNDPAATTRYITDELNRVFPAAITLYAASPATFTPGSMTTEQLNAAEAARTKT